MKFVFYVFDFFNQFKIKGQRVLTTEAHITKSVISIFFRETKICCVCRCFQSVVFLIFYNSTNSIDKVKFNIVKTKRFFNFLQKR